MITATGLRLLASGGMTLAVDGRDVKLPQTMAYKAMMLDGVPNFAFTAGYTNASWTPKADLVSEYVVRLLRHLDSRGYDQCVPVRNDPAVVPRPLLDLRAGYVLRSVREFPSAGSGNPWKVAMSYPHDLLKLRFGRIGGPAVRFSRRPGAAPASPRAAAAASRGPGG